MKISNNFLAIIIIIVLATSLFVNLFALNSFQNDSYNSYTAHATIVHGTFELSIAPAISIQIPDYQINFGSCVINVAKNNSLFDSNQSQYYGDNALCVNGTYPDYFVVENKGNTDTNLTIKTSKNATNFFYDEEAWLAFAGNQFPGTIPCNGTLQNTYLNLTNEKTVCTNFSPSNKVQISMQAFVTNESSNGGNLDITLTAYDI